MWSPGEGLGRVNPESSLAPTGLLHYRPPGPADLGVAQVWREKGSTSAQPSGGSYPPRPPETALFSSHPQNLPCRHSLSLAIRRHPHFRDLFDLSIPVLLSGNLFTQELWDSLSRHKAPYGWQGLSSQGNLQPSGLN